MCRIRPRDGEALEAGRRFGPSRGSGRRARLDRWARAGCHATACTFAGSERHPSPARHPRRNRAGRRDVRSARRRDRDCGGQSEPSLAFPTPLPLPWPRQRSRHRPRFVRFRRFFPRQLQRVSRSRSMSGWSSLRRWEATSRGAVILVATRLPLVGEHWPMRAGRCPIGLGVSRSTRLLGPRADDRRSARERRAVGLRDEGSARDTLHLDTALVGASVAYTPAALAYLSWHAGIGALVGSVFDDRDGVFTSEPHGQQAKRTVYGVSPAQRRAASYLYMSLGVAAGFHPAPRWWLGLEVEAMPLIALRQPTWDSKGHFEGPSGDSSFAGDSLTGRALILFTPAIGLRYEL